MAEPGIEVDHETEAVQTNENSVQQPEAEAEFLYELNLLTVLLPLCSSSSTEDYFNGGEEEKKIEQVQARACGSRAKTRVREKNDFKFAGRKKAPKVHVVKDFR